MRKAWHDIRNVDIGITDLFQGNPEFYRQGRLPFEDDSDTAYHLKNFTKATTLKVVLVRFNESSIRHVRDVWILTISR